MKTQKSNITRVSFIALFAIMTLQVTSQVRAGRNSAPAFASASETVSTETAVDTVKLDSVAQPAKEKVLVTTGIQEKKAKKEKEEKFYTTPGFCPHEFSVWAGGGFSSLNAFPTFGDRDYRFGGIAGLGYAYHFNENWALSLGVEIALYNMKMQINDLTDDYTAQDPDGEDIRYITQIDGYTEKQRLYQLNIPLQVWYQTPLNARGDEIYLSLGGKFGVPLSAAYSSHDAHFIASGYYPALNQELYDQRDLGYGDNSGRTMKEKLNFNCSYIGSAEAGVKWKLNDPRYNLYTGFYFDYGFNDILKSNDKTFLEYDQRFPDRFRTNSALVSQYTQSGETSSFADKVSVVALGLKVRMGFNLCSDKGVKRPEAYDSSEKVVEKPEEPKKEEPKKEEPVVRNVKPIEYTEPVVENKPYYTSNPLLEAEMKRATSEYGKLADLVVLQVDGYEVNQTRLTPAMEKMLDEKVRMLQKYNSDKYVIICEGHTCDLGREEFNLNLAQKRAEVIREYLMTKGFNDDNLVATSKGKSTPIVLNINEDNRKVNRRVVFLIKERK